MQHPEIVLSRYAAFACLAAKIAGEPTASVSPDLNRSVVDVAIDDSGAAFPATGEFGPVLVSWETLNEIAEHETGCFAIDASGAAERLFVFSTDTSRAISLWAHETGAPTLNLAGFPMHRMKGVDPSQDTVKKMEALAPVSGRVLDICTGLGYTSILASKSAASVTTIELDSAVLQLARRNPWSQELFTSPRITSKLGDASEMIPALPDGGFDLIFHDPPTMQIAGDLYSGKFYAHLHRILSRRGRLFHYIGSPNSRHGATVTRGVHRRLKENGFEVVVAAPDAFGLVASKLKR